jgi:hypothetical protein
MFTISVLLAVDIALAQGIEDYEKAPINYSKAMPHDPASVVQARLAKGELPPGETDHDFVKILHF